MIFIKFFFLLLKDKIKKLLNLWSYEELTRIIEIEFLIKFIKNRNLNDRKFNHLDIGGGNGLYCHRMASHGFLARSSVIDKFCNSHFLFPHYKLDLKKFNNNFKFNIITCMLVLEFVKSRLSFLKKIHSLANKNNLVFFSVPNPKSIEHKLWKKKFKKKNGFYFVRNQKLFSIKKFEQELNKAQFKIVNVKPMIFLPIYATNPRVRFNKGLYFELNSELKNFSEPSVYLYCVKAIKNKC